ncbi:GMC oxidoreductase [Gluconacetobacter takamatsuzukensis]|uniref:NAD-dependent epimerase/dehydratase family protein n=1 Tax=Gluconacetobacter takamatsuzukensis TaxID=1286190 RepID=A0A7W4KEU1_9PROT|nr:GMC oxidoreductase [Gluconacetobacter takamatsuzukensis]MBB2205622.1 NAD-dependent epimerase/dehydratase family protein [Gluconacetobacter takamatsuzukensis]
MTGYVDFEAASDSAALSRSFDIVIVGGGAAGLTLVRELAGHNLKIAVLESGDREETPEIEELNEVEVEGSLRDDALQDARRRQNEAQLKVWRADRQRFGVRCRVLGGSTAAWAGKVAPFDALDYAKRAWIPDSGWPVGAEELRPFLERAARYLDLGPLLQGQDFWKAIGRREPAELAGLGHFRSFFWQFARSRHALTDVMRFGPDFLGEDYRGVTVFLKATVGRVRVEQGVVTGVDVISSLTGRNRGTIRCNQVVLAAGTIENARLLLLSPGAAQGPVGRYLTDHPSIVLGDFAPEYREKAAALLGFYPLQKDYRVYMYACGVALAPEVQAEERMPNMAAFAGVSIANDDPLVALGRLAKRESDAPVRDGLTVLRNAGLVVSSVGRKLLNYRRIPEKIRRAMADAAVFLNANMVAREYVGGGRGRRLDQVTLNIISEQPPEERNRITLSDRTDRLGLRLAAVSWDISDALRRSMLRFGRLLMDDLERSGVKGFRLSPAFASDDSASLVVYDMAHTAGTTRMGTDPATSVVDPALQVHGVGGLHVVGASVFPTSGHANPTLMIMGLAVRLADRLREEIMETRLGTLSALHMDDDTRPLVVVTGATGNLGHAVIGQLARRGYRIRGQFRSSIPDDVRVEWVHCDFARSDLADSVFDDLVHGAVAVIHLAASLSKVEEMDTANVANLERLAQACVRQGVSYFGQASSMVVYGSPTTRLVTEETPRIDLGKPIAKQYFFEYFMQEYARSKILGEDILARYKDGMHIDIYRIAVAQDPVFLVQSLNWSRMRKIFSLYRNSHFISSTHAARAMVHLMERGLKMGGKGIEVYNISDRNSPTFADVRKAAGLKTGFNVPLLFDVLKGIKMGRTLSPRYPMGFFRIDNRKLEATGFSGDSDQA